MTNVLFSLPEEAIRQAWGTAAAALLIDLQRRREAERAEWAERDRLGSHLHSLARTA